MYTIDGETYDNTIDVMIRFGAGDYTRTDWLAIAAMSHQEVVDANRQVYPELSDNDLDELALATLDHASEIEAQP